MFFFLFFVLNKPQTKTEIKFKSVTANKISSHLLQIENLLTYNNSNYKKVNTFSPHVCWMKDKKRNIHKIILYDLKCI